MKALVVGLGSVGRRHLANLRALQPEAELGVLRSGSGGRGDTTGLADYVVYDLDQALTHQPDVAVIAGPASQHVETATALARHGVHLLVEKPISDRLDGVDGLIGECKDRGLTLMVGYVLRFLPSLGHMRTAVSDGCIGRLLAIRAEVGQYLPDWRPNTDYRQTVTARSELGGGAFLELSHELDYLRWIGGEVMAVRAWSDRMSDLEIDVEDVAEITMELASGAVATAHLDLLDHSPVRRCRAVGSLGTLELDLLVGSLYLHRSKDERAELWAADPTDRNGMFLAELTHFLDCVRTGTPAIVTGRDGQAVLRTALAARRASLTGERVTVATCRDDLAVSDR